MQAQTGWCNDRDGWDRGKLGEEGEERREMLQGRQGEAKNPRTQLPGELLRDRGSMFVLLSAAHVGQAPSQPALTPAAMHKMYQHMPCCHKRNVAHVAKPQSTRLSHTRCRNVVTHATRLCVPMSLSLKRKCHARTYGTKYPNESQCNVWSSKQSNVQMQQKQKKVYVWRESIQGDKTSPLRRNHV